MMKLLVALSVSMPAGLHAADVAVPAGNGNIRLGGRPGELMQKAMQRRVFSEEAQTAIYDEAENAFATHWDSSHCGWQNEYWGKTMLSVAGAIESTGDKTLAGWALEKTHAFLNKFQRADGYLSTYADSSYLRTKPESKDPNDHWCHNIWGQKYTLWGLLEFHRVTGDKTCLDAAEKMADHIVANLRKLDKNLEDTGSWCGISSLSILKPLLQLYRLRPKAEYRALAEHAVRATDVEGGEKPAQNVIHDALSDVKIKDWYENPYILAKSYEILSYFEGVADYHRLTGDVRALAAVKAFYGHLVREELNAMRSVGYFDHFLFARSHVNGMVELCDVVHWIRLNRELYLLTGKTEHLDRIEEAFYNAFLAGVAPEGDWGAHIIRSHGTRHLAAPEQTGMKLHQCCPDNMLRTFYDWSDMVADVAKDGAWEVNFYSDADIVLPDARMELRGNYPVSETFRLRVVAEKDGKLRLRVPYWTNEIVVDGKMLKPSSGRIEIPLAAGERTLAVALKMPPRVIDSEAPDFEDIDTVTDLDTAKPEGYTKRFMSWYTPEMEGLARRTPAAQVMRGPLVLAKGRVVGTSRMETLEFNTINKQPGWKLSLAPQKRTAANAAPWGVWNLTLERDIPGKGVETKTIPVADYWSASCMDDPENWFSLWF